MMVCKNCGYIHNVDDYNLDCPTCHTTSWEDWYIKELHMLRYDGSFLREMEILQEFNPIEFQNRIDKIGIKVPDVEKCNGTLNYKECPHCNSLDVDEITNIPNANSKLTGITNNTLQIAYLCKNCGHIWKRGSR